MDLGEGLPQWRGDSALPLCFAQGKEQNDKGWSIQNDKW